MSVTALRGVRIIEGHRVATPGSQLGPRLARDRSGRRPRADRSGSVPDDAASGSVLHRCRQHHALRLPRSPVRRPAQMDSTRGPLSESAVAPVIGAFGSWPVPAGGTCGPEVALDALPADGRYRGTTQLSARRMCRDPRWTDTSTMRHGPGFWLTAEVSFVFRTVGSFVVRIISTVVIGGARRIRP
jgi:hypothetical protein